jgi:hypothetical protein
MYKSLLGILLLIALAACTAQNEQQVTLSVPAATQTRTQLPPPPTPLPLTPTQTSPAGWQQLVDDHFKFSLYYPPEAELLETSAGFYHINLPVQEGTNLGEKYLEITLSIDPAICTSPNLVSFPPEMLTSENRNLGVTDFTFENGSEGAMGSTYETFSYSTWNGQACANLSFVLRASNPDMFESPPPLYDREAETVIFNQIASTFVWQK